MEKIKISDLGPSVRNGGVGKVLEIARTLKKGEAVLVQNENPNVSYANMRLKLLGIPAKIITRKAQKYVISTL